MKPMARIGCAGLMAFCLCIGVVEAQPARLMPSPAIDFLGTVLPCASDDECPNTSFCVLPPTGQPGSGTCYLPKNRYLSIDPNPANAGLMTARRLSVQTDAGPVALGWMDDPVFGDSFKLTRLVVTPFYRDWTTRDTVELADCHVAPRYTYLIQAIEEGQDTANEANYSEPLVLRTVDVWSDMAGPSVEGQFSPPNCVLNIEDVSVTVQLFIDEPVAPQEIADIVEEIPDGVVDPSDIIEIWRAFEGSPYPFRDPCSCAGLAPCPPPSTGGCTPAQYVCGDGVLEPGEHCDDGNTAPGDGCDAFCQDETLGGPTMRIVPVDASGQHTINGNEIVIAEAGQFVTLEVRVDNWNPVGDIGSCPDQTPCSVTAQNCVSGACRQTNGVLDVYQARFNLAELAGAVRLPTVSCTSSLDCRVLGAPSILSSCDLETGQCDVRSAIWVDQEREDFVFFDAVGPTALVDGVRQNPALANACLFAGLANGVVYKGQEKYAGTIVLEVLPGTEGSMTVDFVRHPDESLLRDIDNFPLTPLRLEPAIITVQGPPIPAVSSWGVVALMLLVLTAGTMALRRRPLIG